MKSPAFASLILFLILWRAIELYASRDRRYGGAVPNVVS